MTGSVTENENVIQLSFASLRIQAAERSHNFVVDSSLQTTSTVVEVSRCRSTSRSPSTNFMHWTSTPMMSNSRRSPSLLPDSVGIDHPCCWKLHGSLRSFKLTGTIFQSILSHSARIQSSRSQYFTSTNHLSCGFISTFY